MLAKEFEKGVRELGLECWVDTDGDARVLIDSERVGTVAVAIGHYQVDTNHSAFRRLPDDKKRKLYELVTEYAATPYAERKKMPLDIEVAILREIAPEFRWIVRSKGGNICVHWEKPLKDANFWISDSNGEKISPFNHLFKWIRWGDGEPVNIADALATYDSEQSAKVTSCAD